MNTKKKNLHHKNGVSIEQISSKLSSLAVEDIAVETNFYTRQDKVITGLAFIGGFFMMLQQGGNTLCDWAEQVGKFLGQLFNPSSINKKLQFPKERFFKQLVEQSLKNQLEKPFLKGKKAKLFSAFKRVFIEDSTCLNLPYNLATFFPGPHNLCRQKR